MRSCRWLSPTCPACPCTKSSGHGLPSALPVGAWAGAPGQCPSSTTLAQTAAVGSLDPTQPPPHHQPRRRRRPTSAWRSTGPRAAAVPRPRGRRGRSRAAAAAGPRAHDIRPSASPSALDAIGAADARRTREPQPILPFRRSLRASPGRFTSLSKTFSPSPPSALA